MSQLPIIFQSWAEGDLSTRPVNYIKMMKKIGEKFQFFDFITHIKPTNEVPVVFLKVSSEQQ